MRNQLKVYATPMFHSFAASSPVLGLVFIFTGIF